MDDKSIFLSIHPYIPGEHLLEWLHSSFPQPNEHPAPILQIPRQNPYLGRSVLSPLWQFEHSPSILLISQSPAEILLSPLLDQRLGTHLLRDRCWPSYKGLSLFG